MANLPMIMAFVSGFLAIVAVNFLLADAAERRRLGSYPQLQAELRSALRQAQKSQSQDSNSLDKLAGDDYHGGERVLKMSWREHWAWVVERSGIKVSLRQLVLISLVIATGFGLLPGVVFSQWLPGLVLAPMATAIPWLYVTVRTNRWLERLRKQLPDVFDMMSRVMRAGQTISQAMQAVADEFPQPAGEEFGYCYEQQNLGLSSGVALRELARRTGLLELKIFAVSVSVHRQTGGNLAELLDKLATILRDRARIHGMIRALTAEGRLQAMVLLALPPLLLASITLVNRPYAMVLYQYPGLLATMFASMVAGAIWMYRIIRFDF